MCSGIKITKCPPAKAYGYDRDTLNKKDREISDWERLDDYAAAKTRRSYDADLSVEPRDYEGDPR